MSVSNDGVGRVQPQRRDQPSRDRANVIPERVVVRRDEAGARSDVAVLRRSKQFAKSLPGPTGMRGMVQRMKDSCESKPSSGSPQDDVAHRQIVPPPHHICIDRATASDQCPESCCASTAAARKIPPEQALAPAAASCRVPDKPPFAAAAAATPCDWRTRCGADELM